MTELACLVMAAGESRRFNGNKLLARVDNKPLLQHAIEKANACNPGHVYAVTGAWHEAILAAHAADSLGKVSFIYNPDWAEGLGKSIATGVSMLANHYDNILILLADQLAITVDDLQRLINNHQPDAITCAFYAGNNGVPAIFSKPFFPALMALTGERGGKGLLNDEGYPVKGVEMANAAVDVDS